MRKLMTAAVLAATTMAVAGIGASSASARADVSDDCPNAAVRAQQGTERLPQCRAYELVSPPEKFGAPVSVVGGSVDGTRVRMASGGGFAGTPSQDGATNNAYVAERAGAAWTTHPLNLPAVDFNTPGEYLAGTADLSYGLMRGATYDRVDPAGTGFYVEALDGSLVSASPGIFNLAAPNDTAEFTVFKGAAADLSSFVFTTTMYRPVLASDPVPAPDFVPLDNIYEVYGARSGDPQVRRADIDGSGNVIGVECGRTVGGARGTRNAVSRDGHTIFFTGRLSSDPLSCTTAVRGQLRVYARVGGTQTVEVSASQCTRVANPSVTPPVAACTTVPATNPPATMDAVYWGASADGKVVYFSTSQQLTNSDLDTTDDLYEYRFDPPAGQPALTQVTAASTSATPGNGALHTGVVRISDDGKRVYFVARGVLTSEQNAVGVAAVSGQQNLYVFERTAEHPGGRVRFISTLVSGDSSLWGNDSANKQAQATADDGRILVFTSSAKLTSDDTDAVADVYEYDVQTRQMTRISRGKRNADGTRFGTDGNAASAASIPTSTRVASTDGSVVVFRTVEALQAEDVNGQSDLYEWHDGTVELITDGASVDNAGAPASYVTPDGSSIFFSWPAQLVAEDQDGTTDVYVARTDGGFLYEPPVVEERCSGDACQGMAVVPPGLGGIGSFDIAGEGNVDPVVEPVRPALTVSKVKARSGAAVSLKVKVPEIGRIGVSGGSVRSVSRKAGKAASYTVDVRLTVTAKAKLKKTGRLSVKVKVTFTSARGPVQSKALTLKLTQPKKTKKTKKRAGHAASVQVAGSKGGR